MIPHITNLLENKIHPKGVEIFTEHSDRITSGEEELECLNCGFQATTLAMKIFNQYNFILYGLCEDCTTEFKESQEEDIEEWLLENPERAILVDVNDHLN